jgi:uncharacterized iron-regulated protein
MKYKKRFQEFFPSLKGIIMSMLWLLFSTLQVSAQHKTGYTIFNGKGKKVTFEKMANELVKSDIILFGESHNNPISHWLQFEVVESLHKMKPLILGAEMFEADNQGPLSDYISGKINAKKLDTLARLWPNYKTDYAPLVNFARDNKLKFVATNIPRKYANLVFKKDFRSLDSLSDLEKSWIAPLPIKYDPSLPGYAGMKNMMGGSHTSETLPKAQAVKDATMAYFISQNYSPGSLFIHFNGSYHSENYEGILWYLKQNAPNLRFATITTVSQANPAKLEKAYLKKADFIICVDENMTTTY